MEEVHSLLADRDGDKPLLMESDEENSLLLDSESETSSVSIGLGDPDAV